VSGFNAAVPLDSALWTVGAALQVEAARIPSPDDGESVRLENIALLHTSFLRARTTRGSSTMVGRIAGSKSSSSHPVTSRIALNL